MAPIIRTPILSEQKHALRTSRAGVTAEAKPAAPLMTAAAAPAAVAERMPPVAAPVAPQIDEQAIEREVKRRLAEREAELQSRIQQDLEARQRAATEAGHAAGQEQARSAVADALAQQQAQFEQVVASLTQSYHLDIARIEAEAAAIAYEAVCKIAGSQLIGPDAVKAMVAQATATLRQNQRLTIRVSPRDHDLLAALQDEATRQAHQWQADDSITLGGCIIETELGELDARLDTQLQAFRDLLLAVNTEQQAR